MTDQKLGRYRLVPELGADGSVPKSAPSGRGKPSLPPIALRPQD